MRSTLLSARCVVVVVLALTASAARAGSDTPSGGEIEPPVDVAPPLAPFTTPAGSRPFEPPAPAPSDELGDIETNVRNALVTVAGKREQKLKDVPMTVSYIPQEELEGTGEFTLCDAIQYFPGMECRQGAMRKAAVSAYGLGSNFLSNRLLLLKDGRPETDPWTGVFYPDETTPLSNIKQIEVIKGPGSSLYGSNAFSGVINVIERTPDDLMKDGRNYGFDVRALAGQDNTYRLQTTVAGEAGPVKALANYYGYVTDGPQLLNNPALGIVDTQEWARVNQVSGKVLIKSLTLDAEYTSSAIGRPGGEEITDVGNCGRCHYTPNDSEHVENFNVNAKLDTKVNDWLHVFVEGYALFKRRVVDLENQITGELQPSLGKRRRLGAEARALVTVQGLSVTVGGDVKHDNVNNENILPGLTDIDTQETIVGGFVDAEYRPFPNLILGAGARYDYYQIPVQVWHDPTSQISPRASIVFHALPELTLRTNYGRAFRAPTLAELAINQQMYASTLLGSPDLRAETLDSYEAAVDFWAPGGQVRLTGSGFYKIANNFINEVFQGGSTSQFQNVGNARVVGGEIEAAAKVPAIHSSFDLAYEYLKAVSVAYNTSATSPLDYAPSNRIYFRGHTDLGIAFADVYAIFVDARQDPALQVLPDGTRGANIILPPYLLANARIGAKVFPGLTVSLLAENLFDTHYEETHGFPQPGRRLFAEIKFLY